MCIRDSILTLYWAFLSTPYLFVDDELVDGENIGRFGMPQGRFTPILSEIRNTEVLDVCIPDRLQCRLFLTTGWSFCFFYILYYTWYLFWRNQLDFRNFQRRQIRYTLRNALLTLSCNISKWLRNRRTSFKSWCWPVLLVMRRVKREAFFSWFSNEK